MKTFRSSKTLHEAGESQVDFQLSSGAAYVDLLNSYLSFDVKISNTTSPPTAITGVKMPAHAGWINMIKSYRVIHSSGVELDRQNDTVGEWVQVQQYYNTSKAKRRCQGGLYQMNDSISPVAVNEQPGYYDVAFENLNVNTSPTVSPARVDENAGTYRAVVPLAQLAGIFDNELLAPSFLTAGLRIELQFYSKEHFFVKTGAWIATDSVCICNPEINLECFQLTDSIVRKLSQISGKTSLYFQLFYNLCFLICLNILYLSLSFQRPRVVLGNIFSL